MAHADWRSAGAYEDLRPLDAPAYAYEFLRRNADFLADHARLTRKAQTQTLDDAEAEEFARRWGLRFQPNRNPHPSGNDPLDARGTSQRCLPHRHSRCPRQS
jgi:hypothetical protein